MMQLFGICLRRTSILGGAGGAKKHRFAAILQLYFFMAMCLSIVAEAKEGFITATFGNAANVEYPRTLKVE